MKAFAIKVKEDCYWLGGFYGKNNYDDIAHAKVYVNKTQAEKQCKLVNEGYGHSAEVVEITIAESDLERQLAEKNKDINKLSKEHLEMFGDMKEYKNLWLAEQRKVEELENKLEHCSNDKWYIDLDKLNIPNEIANQIKKQVCDEIREKLKAHCDYTDEDNIGWYLTEHKIDILLDQMEQAKVNCYEKIGEN